jgi:hypothetical protein
VPLSPEQPHCHRYDDKRWSCWSWCCCCWCSVIAVSVSLDPISLQQLTGSEAKQSLAIVPSTILPWPAVAEADNTFPPFRALLRDIPCRRPCTVQPANTNTSPTLSASLSDSNSSSITSTNRSATNSTSDAARTSTRARTRIRSASSRPPHAQRATASSVAAHSNNHHQHHQNNHHHRRNQSESTFPPRHYSQHNAYEASHVTPNRSGSRDSTRPPSRGYEYDTSSSAQPRHPRSASRSTTNTATANATATTYQNREQQPPNLNLNLNLNVSAPNAAAIASSNILSIPNIVLAVIKAVVGISISLSLSLTTCLHKCLLPPRPWLPQRHHIPLAASSRGLGQPFRRNRGSGSWARPSALAVWAR